MSSARITFKSEKSSISIQAAVFTQVKTTRSTTGDDQPNDDETSNGFYHTKIVLQKGNEW